jgi:penicillin-binding protein 2
VAFLGQEEQIREFQERFKYLYAILFIGVGILLSRMVYLQVLKGDEMRQYSEENRIKRVKIPAPRGMIFDREGKLLVDNRPAFYVNITPQYLKESGKPKEVIEQLSQVIKIPVDEIEKKINLVNNELKQFCK